MDIREIRRLELKRLVSQFETTAAFARAHDLDPTYISQLLNGHRRMGEKAARKIEAAVGLAPFALDRASEADAVHPDEVSATGAERSGPAFSFAQPKPSAPALSDLQRALLASTEGLDYGQVADVIAYARRLHAGTARNPRPAHTYLDEPITPRAGGNHSARSSFATAIAAIRLRVEELRDHYSPSNEDNLAIIDELVDTVAALEAQHAVSGPDRRQENHGPPDDLPERRAVK